MDKDKTFDFTVFSRLKEVEGDHFWFDVRRKWIFDKIKKFKRPPATFLEVGCGTGNVSSYLSSRGYSVTGCEYSEEAIKLGWPGFNIIKADARNLPFVDESFDMVGLFDVIEHFEDDLYIINEAKRILTKKGIMVITVPANEELWSDYDIKSFHKRRYNKKTLVEVLSKAGLQVLLVEYMFMSLYLPMKYIRNKNQNDDPFKINKYVNKFLKILFNIERKLSQLCSLPFGTSLIAIAQK